MNAEEWLNKHCVAKDWSDTANQAKDSLDTDDVLVYMEAYHKYKVENLGLFNVRQQRELLKDFLDFVGNPFELDVKDNVLDNYFESLK